MMRIDECGFERTWLSSTIIINGKPHKKKRKNHKKWVVTLRLKAHGSNPLGDIHLPFESTTS